jgi:hypothetical protein
MRVVVVRLETEKAWCRQRSERVEKEERRRGIVV